MRFERMWRQGATAVLLAMVCGWGLAQEGPDEAVDAADATIDAPDFDYGAADGTGDAAPAKPRPSEIQPLATRALLLDLTRSNGRLFAAGERGTVLASRDGSQWAQVIAPVRAPLTAMHFADDTHGWAVGHDASILRTADGGRSWELQNFEPELEMPLLDVLFLDARRGFAVGAYGLFYTTTDGGENWEEVESPIRDAELHFSAIARLASGELFIAGEQGTLAVSADDGATWTQLDSPYEGSYFGALPYGERGVLVFGLRGNVYVSDDARGNWRQVDLGTRATLFGGTRLDDGSYVLVGLAGTVRRLGADGSVQTIPLQRVETDAQGRRHVESLSGTLSAVIALSDTELLVVGENGVVRIPATGKTSTPDDDADIVTDADEDGQ